MRIALLVQNATVRKVSTTKEEPVNESAEVGLLNKTAGELGPGLSLIILLILLLLWPLEARQKSKSAPLIEQTRLSAGARLGAWTGGLTLALYGASLWSGTPLFILAVVMTLVYLGLSRWTFRNPKEPFIFTL